MIALITGASSGMGLKYASKLAEMGYDLIMVSNQLQELESAAADIASRCGIRAIPRFQDLSRREAAEELYAFCKENSYEVEILVNNAGMFFFKELEPSDLSRVDAMMGLHMETVTRMCILFGAGMKRRGHGYILNMSSMAAKLPTPGITVYSATKAYLKSFGKSLAFEMRPYGVGVTTVCPAAIATPLYKLKPSLMELGVKVGVIKTPDWLVGRALKALFRRRPIIRPGFMNVWLPALIAALPRPLEDRIWRKLK